MHTFPKRVLTGLTRLCILGLILTSGYSVAQDDNEARLAELREQLKQRQATIRANQADAQELQEILEQSEKEIGQAASRLNRTQQAQAENETRQQELGSEQQSLKAAIVDQQDMLASQLRSAFMAGNYDYAKMIFYQEEAKSFERILTYYKYINQARQREIARFKQNVARLEEVEQQLEDKARELANLITAQQHQQAELVARKEDRRRTLVRLNQKIATDEAQVKELQNNEEALVEAIEQARRAAEQAKTRLEGLARLKGKLLRPASGKVRRLFGTRRQGEVRWKGIIINAAEGSAVKAVSHGQIVYANWLKGFGLVVIVDHGKGYMSVYGHNQALLKQAGDKVGRGEQIALVGQSGGQSSPNLYFEVRHKGKALNPSSWLDL